MAKQLEGPIKYSKIRESNKRLADGVFTNIKENTKGAT